MRGYAGGSRTTKDERLTVMMSEKIEVHEGDEIVARPARNYAIDQAVFHGGVRNENIIGQWLPFWTRNLMEMYPHVDVERHNMGRILNAWDGKTAVIPSTGPSLDRNLEELKAIPRDAYSIVTTTSAINPLVANGLIPDVAVIGDAKHWIHEIHVRGHEEWLKETPLILSTMMHPETAKHWPGPLFFHTDWSDQEGVEMLMSDRGMNRTIYPELPSIPVSGCTTNLAIRVAAMLGFTKVILLGMDLGFSGRSAHGTKFIRLFNDDSGRWFWNSKNERENFDGSQPVFDGPEIPEKEVKSEWLKAPEAHQFFMQKAKWIFRACPDGHGYTVQEWLPSQPLEPADEEWKNCDQCGKTMRHTPTSAEYLFYLHLCYNLTAKTTVNVDFMDGKGIRPRNVLFVNSTGAGIATMLPSAPLSDAMEIPPPPQEGDEQSESPATA